MCSRWSNIPKRPEKVRVSLSRSKFYDGAVEAKRHKLWVIAEALDSVRVCGGQRLLYLCHQIRVRPGTRGAATKDPHTMHPQRVAVNPSKLLAQSRHFADDARALHAKTPGLFATSLWCQNVQKRAAAISQSGMPRSAMNPQIIVRWLRLTLATLLGGSAVTPYMTIFRVRQ